MKKLLLSVALACFGFASNDAYAYTSYVINSPVVNLENGKTYYIYDATGDDGTANEPTSNDTYRYAFRWDNNGSIHGTHVKPCNVPLQETYPLSNNHVWTATSSTADDNSTVWSFQNVGTGKYWKSADAGTSENADDKGLFVIEGETSDHKVKVYGTDNKRWDGNGGGNNPFVYWNGNGHTIRFYEALAENDGYIIAGQGGWTVTYTYPAYNGTIITQTASVANGADAADFIPAVTYFTPTGLAESDGTVSDGKISFTVTGSWNFPMEMNKVYRVKLKPSDSNSKNIKLNGTEVLAAYTDTDESNLNSKNLWYFKFSSMDSDGQISVTMHTLGAEDSKGLEFGDDDNSRAALSDTPTPLAVVPTTWTQRAEGDFCLKKDFETGNDNWINHRSPYFSTWKNNVAQGNDGSVIRLSTLVDADFDEIANYNPSDQVEAAKDGNPDLLRALLENVNPYATDITNYITNADAFAALGVATAESVSAWETLKSGLPAAKKDYTETNHTETLEAYHALVNSSANTAGGAHIKLSCNQVPDDYLCVRLNNNAYIVRRNGNDVNGNKTTWTLQPADGGFYLYNEYSGKYAKFPTVNNGEGLTAVSNTTDASVFVFDIYDPSTARYGVKCVSSDTHETYCYLHTNTSTNVVRWEKGNNSSWYLHRSDEATAIYEATLGANEDVDNARNNSTFAGTIGSGLGEYSATGSGYDAYIAALDAINNITDETTNADKHTAASALRSAYSSVSFSLNLPAPGRFYRFSGSDKYLTSDTASDDGRILMGATENNGASTVVYLTPDNKLVALSSGLVLGNFSSVDRTQWTFVAPESANTGTVVFSENTNTAGKYSIGLQGSGANRYIYHAGSSGKVDCGANDNGAGYAWTIEEAEYLPIPVGESKHITIYSPVTLENSYNRFNLHTLAVNDEYAEIIKTPVEDGGYILPNTVYYGEITTEEAPVNGCYYLRIVGNEPTAALTEEEADPETPATRIIGSFLATDKQEGTNYYTIGVNENGVVHFLNHTDDTLLSGFTAYVASTDPSDAVTTLGGFKLVTKDEATTSIREIEKNAQSADTIHDLYGRRVNKADRGLYIINGKKVLVK